MPRFVKIRSWHVVKTVTRSGGYLTRCGRYAPQASDTSNDLGAERSCETCLRIEVDG